MSKLAILGGEKVATSSIAANVKWPIINRAMEESVISVLRDGNMSGTDITKQFEIEFAKWNKTEYALAQSSGTSCLQAAMFGVGLGHGDELICPSTTYWASALPAMSLGATIVYADIDPKTLCLDPKDFEKRITPRTKAVVVVHYCSYPAPMDEIMAIARKHNIKVIEDVSHAQGGFYKGQMLGTIGDVAAMSLMSGKSFAIGEGGILVTNDREIYERAMLWGHYERAGEINLPGLAEYKGLPCGGYKYRMHQLSSVVGLEQLKKYDSECAVIDAAMKYFWDGLKDLPLDPHMPADAGSTKAGWYACKGIYNPDAFEGLSLKYFIDAVIAEGGQGFGAGCNAALHTHGLVHSMDVYGEGKPTNTANLPAGADTNINVDGSLPVAENICNYAFSIPWFKHFDRALIDEQIAAVRKVAENYKDLLATDPKEKVSGKFFQTARKN
ncbi:MAG: DegT/DnrJ/EryC1/StrS family aminotransferase [Lentisphaerae bacterium]|nr:DegT/DnrJ/EryC1/StrS family aminotransferase [Lentisphaerota bacterium]